MSNKSRTKHSGKKSLANEVLAVVLVVAAILLVLSLFTYDPRDPSFNSVGPQREPHNIIGVVGAFISDVFLQWFGLASLLVPVLLVLVAIRAFSTTNPGFPARKAIGATFLLIAFSGFLALFPDFRIGLLARAYNGGAIGKVIETGLAGVMSTTGAAIVLAAASVLTLMLTMEISLARIAAWARSAREAGAETSQTKRTVFSRLSAWWEARSEQRQQIAAQKRVEKELEQRRREEERAERERLKEIEEERLREERKVRMEEARRLKEEIPGVRRPVIETVTPSPQPEIAVAGSGVSGGTAVRLASSEGAEAVPSITSTRLQMREIVHEHATRVEQIKSGISPLAAEVTMDPKVAEMISTASIVRTPATEKAEPDPKSSKQATRRKAAVETLAGYVYKLPNIDLIEPPIGHFEQAEEVLRERATILAEKCKEFAVTGHIHRINPGPVVTTFEFKPDPGIKYSRVVGLADDLCLALKAESIRIDRIAGKSTVGIEAPNAQREKIFLRDVIESAKFQQSASKLTVALGKTINGEEYIADLTKMPHLLIAGATGAGKSVTLNAIICSVLYKASPEEVKFIMVDPKRVELGLYEGIPHLLTPIVTDPKRASNALKWAVNEMEARYRKLASLGVRNIEQFNRQIYEMTAPTLFDDPAEPLKPLPYIVIAIDELADLMMIARSEVETSIARLAQMARAVGIHLVLATQRPSVDIITGVIKANIPCRMAFRVSSKVDSRTIIDSNGAEALLGQGDMLFLPPASSRLVRVHGSYASEAEIKRITDFIRQQAQPDYNEEVTLSEQESLEADGFEGEQDELFDEALVIVTDMARASTSVLQRRLSIGYGRAAKILDSMERQGFIGPAEGSKPRKVLQAAYEFRERVAQRQEEDFE